MWYLYIHGISSDTFQHCFNIARMHAFKDQFPNKGKNADYSQSSYYPINALSYSHFWVYDQQCAFTPQFSPLSKSASGSILGSRFLTAALESLKKTKKKTSPLTTTLCSWTSASTYFIQAFLLLKQSHQICNRSNATKKWIKVVICKW